MAFDIGQYIYYLKHDNFWLGIIRNDINKLLVNREYIEFFMQIYMQWSSDNSIECLPHYEKMDFSQFKVYIEVEKMNQCYVCNNCNMIIFIKSSNNKEGFLCILQMLRINTGLWNWNKKNGYHIHLRDNNQIGIDKPCINIAKSELLFVKYRMALNRDKDAIEFQKDDAINRIQIFFDFMLRMFNNLTQLYFNLKVILLVQS